MPLSPLPVDKGGVRMEKDGRGVPLHGGKGSRWRRRRRRQQPKNRWMRHVRKSGALSGSKMDSGDSQTAFPCS